MASAHRRRGALCNKYCIAAALLAAPCITSTKTSKLVGNIIFALSFTAGTHSIFLPKPKIMGIDIGITQIRHNQSRRLRSHQKLLLPLLRHRHRGHQD